MTKKGFWVGAAAVAAIAFAGVIVFESEDSTNTVAEKSAANSIHSPAVSVQNSNQNSNYSPPTIVASQSIANGVEANKIQESSATFRVDNSGALILDEQTRVGIEGLVGQTDADKLAAAIAEQTNGLPVAAIRRAEELVDRFRHYSEAQRQSYPPGVAPPTEDDALVQLDGLHALRVAHFGSDVAAAFYANEEKLSRELVELMRLEKDQSLTMSEKAERAQALHDRLPTVAAIERKNREPPVSDER